MRYTLARSMKYEREQLGDGFSVPCARLCLAANGGPSVARGLAAQIFRLVDTEGALLIRGTGLRSPHEFAAFLEAIEFQPHSYVGGTTPRTEYAAGVYTATDLPHDRRILLHQEMAYLDDVPDYVVFYCQEPPEHGQKTNLIGDMRAFTEKLPESFKRRFRGKRARLRRRLPAAGGSNGAYTNRKSWQESLGTDDRREAGGSDGNAAGSWPGPTTTAWKSCRSRPASSGHTRSTVSCGVRRRWSFSRNRRA